MERIYLDHNATTPVRPEVVEAMARVLRDVPGNPSSVHAEGAAARAVLDRAREQVAAALGVAADEVIFTSGATEANNTALAGVGAARTDGRRHLVSTAVEHPSLEAALLALEARGFPVTRVSVERSGRVAAEAVRAALRPDTALVSVIWANNETGVLQPVEAVADSVRECGAWLHSDVTQALGKHALPAAFGPLDLLSLSAHKLGGPKGVGALVVRRGVPVEALLLGGPQERRRRGGTENLAGIAGLGVACERAAAELTERTARDAALRDRLWHGIAAHVPGAVRNGDPAHTLANTSSVSFPGLAGELLVQALDLEGVAVSSGAACASGSIEPSPVLTAMGLDAAAARGTLRFSLGRDSTAAQIDRVLAILPGLVERIRASEAA